MQTEQKAREVNEQTEFLHAFLIRFIQEEVALFNSTMDLEAQTQTGIFHQLRVDVMDQGLQHKRDNEKQIPCLLNTY